MQLKGHKFSGGLEKQTVEAFGTRCFAGSLMPKLAFRSKLGREATLHVKRMQTTFFDSAL